MPIAIVSVSDKKGVVEFSRGLVKLGWTLMASGGTSSHLRGAEVDVTDVAKITNTPEILDGRVKTLHPAIHAGLLARDCDRDRQQLAANGWTPIDMAVVNLYPFEAAVQNDATCLADAIEIIDIGGVAIMRAAAKNFQRVILAADPDDYAEILAKLKEGHLDLRDRRRYAIRGFEITARYDQMIHDYLSQGNSHILTLHAGQKLRYGENPHQSADFWGFKLGQSPLGAEILHGKPLSYNNILDLDAAWRTILAFQNPAICIVKHLSPCGVAVGESLVEAYDKALSSDPVSAFGSVIASNRPIDLTTAKAMSQLFVECVAAPGFSEGAFALLSKKKNIRLLRMPEKMMPAAFEYRSVLGGMLRQTVDRGDPAEARWRVVTERQPTAAEWEDLRFAWRACQFVKSNAVVLAKHSGTVGIGGGQPNRVDCVRMAALRAGENARNAVMASDAFFPFPDSLEVAAKAGVTAVIQPGGSIRDPQVIAAARQNNLAMVLTGVRHFRH